MPKRSQANSDLSREEPVEGVIISTSPRYVVRLVTGEEVRAGHKLPRRFGCLFGTLVGWNVKVVVRCPPKSARIVELFRPHEVT
jgi:hypothetical protein